MLLTARLACLIETATIFWWANLLNVPDFAHVSERYRACSTMPMPKNRKPRAARRRSRRSDPLIRNAIVRSNYAARRPGHPGPHRHKAPTARAPRCSTQRAGIAPPHAEGDGLSGVTSDGETCAFISVPASFVGGVPVTRARIPWAMPKAST
jgi:hypothetical protein